jgi:hypothetical protein
MLEAQNDCGVSPLGQSTPSRPPLQQRSFEQHDVLNSGRDAPVLQPFRSACCALQDSLGLQGSSYMSAGGGTIAR